MTKITGILHDDVCTFMKYLTKFLEWEILWMKVVQKIKRHILCSITLCQKLCHSWDKAEKYGTAGQATDDDTYNMVQVLCTLDY